MERLVATCTYTVTDPKTGEVVFKNDLQQARMKLSDCIQQELGLADYFRAIGEENLKKVLAEEGQET